MSPASSPSETPPQEPAPGQTASSPKPRRRWLRYSLRSLLAVMLLCGLAAAWVGREIQQGRDQLAAIRWVESQGGAVYYEVQAEPIWQQRWLGAWYPDRVSHVDLDHTPAEDLAPLAPLADLKALLVGYTQVRDFTPLEEFEQLRYVNILGTPEAQARVAELKLDRPQMFVWPDPLHRPGFRRPPRWVDAQGRVWAFEEVLLEVPPADADQPLDTLAAVGAREGDFVVLYEYEVAGFDAQGRSRWSVSFEGSYYECRMGCLQLPGGDLIVLGYSHYADSGVHLLRLDPATGDVRWKTHCSPSHPGWGYSVEGFSQQVEADLQGEELLIVSQGSLDDTFVELLHVEDGRQLDRWEFDHRW